MDTGLFLLIHTYSIYLGYQFLIAKILNLQMGLALSVMVQKLELLIRAVYSLYVVRLPAKHFKEGYSR